MLLRIVRSQMVENTNSGRMGNKTLKIRYRLNFRTIAAKSIETPRGASTWAFNSQVWKGIRGVLLYLELLDFFKYISTTIRLSLITSKITSDSTRSTSYKLSCFRNRRKVCLAGCFKIQHFNLYYWWTRPFLFFFFVYNNRWRLRLL